MKTKKYLAYWFVVLFSIFLAGCNIISYYQQDSFYRDGSDWDHLRFPLIKPYYAIYITDEYGWGVPLEGSLTGREFYYYFQIDHVQKIAIDEGVIMVYTPITNSVDESLGEKVLYWFVFIPEQDVQMGFEQEVDFYTYIQQLGIQEPSWREPDDILSEYDQTRCLDWIPSCK